MRSITFDLTGSNAIEQGATLNWLYFVLPGNLTNWTPKGEIRSKYLEEGGILKGAFQFKPLIYGEVTLEDGVTKIIGTILRPFMSEAETRSLDWAGSRMKVRSSSQERPVPGKNVWVYDIEMRSPTGEVSRIVRGFVEVSLEATE